jgi:uncharacterized protein YjbI with pentapeptide repeats
LDTDLKTLADASNEAAKRVAGEWLVLISLAVYLVIAAGATTHEALLIERPLQLPIFNVQVPLVGFYWLAPLLMLAVHAYVLLQIDVLRTKVARFLRRAARDAGGTSEPAFREAALRLDAFPAAQVQISARTGVASPTMSAMLFLTLAVLPITTLLFLQVQFLPYQSEVTTLAHKIIIALDIVILWRLWPIPTWGVSRRGRLAWRLVLGTVGAITLGFALIIISLPKSEEYGKGPLAALRHFVFGEVPDFLEQDRMTPGDPDPITLNPRSLLSRRLVVQQREVVREAVPTADARLAAGRTTLNLRGRSLRFAVLDHSDLRGVDFSGAQMDRVGLRWTRLEGAVFDGANMPNARMGSANAPRARFNCLDHTRSEPPRCTDLSGAFLNGADLSAASLEGAILQGADLGSVQFIAASLRNAKLQGAVLTRARLHAANLSGARMQMATLAGSRLHAADLTGALLDGTWCWMAALDGAVLGRPPMRGATFQDVSLSRTRLIGGQLVSPLFSGASDPRGPLGVTPEDREALARAASLSGGAAVGEAARARLNLLSLPEGAPEVIAVAASWPSQLPIDPEDRGHAQILTDLACLDMGVPLPLLASALLKQLRERTLGDNARKRVIERLAVRADTARGFSDCPAAEHLSDRDRANLGQLRQSVTERPTGSRAQ